MFNVIQSIQELLIATALGGLIGLEREFGREVQKKAYPFGIRTTVLLCILGLLFVFLGELINLTVSIVTGLASVIILSVSSYIIRSNDNKAYGLTSHAAIIISYVIGVLVGFGEYLIAISVAVLTTALLGLKKEIHSFIKLMTRSELKSAIEFFIIAFIILPLLPDTYIDLFSIFNPFKFWLIVVSISTIGFISFLSLKASARGLSLTGFLSGFISSKLSAVRLASLVKEDPSLREPAFNGILLSIASTITLAMIISFIGFFNLSLLSYVFMPLFISTVIMLLFFIKKASPAKHSIKLERAFSLANSLKFAILLFLFIFIFTFTSKFIDQSLIYVAVLISALISNLASVASITSMAASGQISLPVAGNLLVFACIISLLDKMVYVKAGRDKKLNSMVMRSTIIWALIIISLLFIQNYLMPL